MSSTIVSRSSVNSVRRTLPAACAAFALQLAGHARHRMAERVEHVALVAFGAEGPRRVDLGARIEQRRVAAQRHDERADVVVVVVLGVVAALQGRRPVRAGCPAPGGRSGCPASANQSRARLPAAACCAGRPLAPAELGKPKSPSSNRLPDDPRRAAALPLDRPASRSRSGGSRKAISRRSGPRLRTAVGEGRIDAGQDLHPRPELGDLPHLAAAPSGRPCRRWPGGSSRPAARSGRSRSSSSRCLPSSSRRA